MHNEYRIGQGYDVHRLVEGRPLILGGVTIKHDKGLYGHSDADVLLHAVTDALFGAAALGDIGRHFPDTDPKYKGADSALLLSLKRAGCRSMRTARSSRKSQNLHLTWNKSTLRLALF